MFFGAPGQQMHCGSFSFRRGPSVGSSEKYYATLILAWMSMSAYARRYYEKPRLSFFHLLKRRIIMINEEFQALVLKQLQLLTEGQARTENRLGGMETDIKSLQNGQSRMETRMDNLEQGQGRMETRMDSLEKSQDMLAIEVMAIKSDLRGVKDTVIRTESLIENEVETRIRALYEAREVHNDRLERIENKVDDISTDVAYIAANIAGFGKLAR